MTEQMMQMMSLKAIESAEESEKYRVCFLITKKNHQVT